MTCVSQMQSCQDRISFVLFSIQLQHEVMHVWSALNYDSWYAPNQFDQFTPPAEKKSFTSPSFHTKWAYLTLNVHWCLTSCFWVHTHRPEVAMVLAEGVSVAVPLQELFAARFNCPHWIQSFMDLDLQQKQGSAFRSCLEKSCHPLGQLGPCNGCCEWGWPFSQIECAFL